MWVKPGLISPSSLLAGRGSPARVLPSRTCRGEAEQIPALRLLASRQTASSRGLEEDERPTPSSWDGAPAESDLPRVLEAPELPAHPAAPASSPAAGAKRGAETHRGSRSRAAGWLTGACGSTVSPLPLSGGMNKPSSPIPQLLRQRPRCCHDARKALGRSSRITQGGRAPQSTRFRGHGELLRAVLAARTAIAAKSFLFRSEKSARNSDQPSLQEAARAKRN